MSCLGVACQFIYHELWVNRFEEQDDVVLGDMFGNGVLSDGILDTTITTYVVFGCIKVCYSYLEEKDLKYHDNDPEQSDANYPRAVA